MNVAAQPQQIRAAFHQKTLVAPLKQMPTAPVSAVEVDRVTDHQPMHPAAQIGLTGLGQKMKMVPHQHKSMQRYLEALRRSDQQLQEFQPVAFAREDALPGIAPPEQMINRPFKLQP